MLGRAFEGWQLGRTGPRFVWSPTEGPAVTLQTWTLHSSPVEGPASTRWVEAAIEVLRRAGTRLGNGVRMQIGRDATRLNFRSVSAKDRWTTHLAVHAEWLCRAPWTDDDLEHAVAHPVQLDGWARIARQLTRAGQQARDGKRSGARGRLTEAGLADVLERWLDPRRAILIITGPASSDEVEENLQELYGGCRSQPSPTAQPTPLSRRRRSVRIRGRYTQLYASWAFEPRSAKEAAAFDALTIALGDPNDSPLKRALVPDHALGVAVRQQQSAGRRGLELMMTLAPNANPSRTARRARSAIGALRDSGSALRRGGLSLRNRTLRRLSTAGGIGDLVAAALLSDESLEAMAQRLEASTTLTVDEMSAIAEQHLSDQDPVVVVGRPRGQR